MSSAGLPSGLGGEVGYETTSRSRGDKGLALPLTETLRLAMQDEDLRQRILFVLLMFAIFALGVHIPVPVPGFSSGTVTDAVAKNPLFQTLNMFGGGALKRLSILSLGLQPYITASIIMQILQTALPQWKKEMQEGGEYARKQNNKRTRILSLLLCGIQGIGFLSIIKSGLPSLGWFEQVTILTFWTAGAMAMLWMGEQISEKGIGNGVSLMIFAGIVLSFPTTFVGLKKGIEDGAYSWISVAVVLAFFLIATYFIVYFTTAQRRIPIQHMRRQAGTKVIGGATSYLPLSVNMAGVLPIIFASSLVYLPSQFGSMLGGQNTAAGRLFEGIGAYMIPGNDEPLIGPISKGVVGAVIYTALIFFFTYFWIAIQYNVEDIANNLKRGGSFIPGVRPGKQTKEFLDSVISRVTLIGAAFIAVVALMQYVIPAIAGLTRDGGAYVSLVQGTSLLIMVSVALETMRQIEATILTKRYGQ